jgi:uncharacterized membrane protein
LITRDFWGTVAGMSRTLILIFGIMCWTGVAASAVIHLAFGDWFYAAFMGTAFVLWAVAFHQYSAKVPART